MQEILIGLVLAVGLGRLAGKLSLRLRMAPVLGEVLAGVLLASLPLGSVGSTFTYSPFFHQLAELGVILMLFAVSLESSIQNVAHIGKRPLLVAIVGLVAPFALILLAFRLGVLQTGVYDPMASYAVAIFAAATLTVTTVGLTTRLRTDNGADHSRAGQLVHRAAAIDDVLGLFMLAAVSAFASTRDWEWRNVLWVLGRVYSYFAVMIPVGYLLIPRLMRKIRSSESRLACGLCLCFFYAGVGAFVGMVPIIGGFFAGLLLDDAEGRMRKAVDPIVQFLAPLFFVLIGTQIRFTAFSSGAPVGRLLGEIAIFLFLAVAGKLLSGFAAGHRADRWKVGLGMVPRGEIGLIFAMAGRQSNLLSERLFTVLVIVILFSTVAPRLFSKRSKEKAAA